MEIKNSIIAIPPGESIKEQLEDRNMSQVEFAERMGFSTKFISQLLNGKVPLTHQTALKLESVLGVPARFLNNLEALYQEDLARIEQEKELESEMLIADAFPFKDMVKKGWIPAKKSPHEKVEELRRFFEVASLGQVNHISKLAPVFRKLDNGKASDFALSAWLQKSYLEARDIKTKSFNKQRLKAAVPKIRSLICESPESFQPKLIEVLSNCGVALILLPHLQDTYAHGATTWENKTKAIVTLSLRGKDADKFWFSLFHELGHLILHEKDHTFIQYDDPAAEDIREAEADAFASDTLIPRVPFTVFLQFGLFSEQAVRNFAAEISTHPGIVVGRLQHDHAIGFNQLNHLKTKYEWTVN